jgi:hypothetical protein
MALKLFKLVMTGQTEATPAETRYFTNIGTADVTISAPYDILASGLFDDNGNLLGITIPMTLATTNGYYMLNVDGVLQQSGLYTVTTLQIELLGTTTPYTILAGSPITLAVTNLSATTTISG